MKAGDWVRTKDRNMMFKVKSVFEKINIFRTEWVTDYNGNEYQAKTVEIVYNPETFAQNNIKPTVEF